MKGLSAIEILVAFAVLTLCMAAAVIVIFGSQSARVGARESREALSIASNMLEAARASADRNFAGAVSLATTTSGIYRQWLSVADIDLYTKRMASFVSWNSGGQTHEMSLSTLITNWRAAPTGYRCPLPPAGNWTAPRQPIIYDFASLIPSGASGWGLSDLQIENNLLYVAAYTTPASDKDDFFIFDISDSALPPRFVGQLATAPTYTHGLEAIAVGEINGRAYAFVASASSFSKGQLQVIDVTDPSAPSLAATYKISTTIVPKAGYGRAIFFRYPYIYLGLTSISGGGDEFDVIDVSNPLAPNWVAGYSVGHGVNAIFVKGNYAYVAHPSASTDAIQEELTVLDVTSPATTPLLNRLSGFHYATGIGGHGEAVDFEGSNLYFGRTASNISGAADSIPEFYILDNSGAPTIAPTPLGSQALPTADSINALFARSYLAFLLNNYELQILDISNPANLTTVSSIPLASAGLAFDCSGALLYIAESSAIVTVAPGN